MKTLTDFITYNSGLLAVIAIVAIISIVAWVSDTYEFRKNQNKDQ